MAAVQQENDRMRAELQQVAAAQQQQQQLAAQLEANQQHLRQTQQQQQQHLVAAAPPPHQKARLPAPDRPSFDGKSKDLKSFRRLALDYLDEFEHLSTAQKIRQVRAMLKGEARNWLDTKEKDDDCEFVDHEQLLNCLRDAFGVFDEQEHVVTEMCVLTPARTSDGTLRAYTDKFRRLYNSLDKENVPSYTVTKSMFLLHLPAGVQSDIRTKLVGVNTVHMMFQTVSQLTHSTGDAMDVDNMDYDGVNGLSKDRNQRTRDNCRRYMSGQCPDGLRKCKFYHPRQDGKCLMCGAEGHYSRDCRLSQSSSSSSSGGGGAPPAKGGNK
jgi:hypothetical protein